MYSAPPSYSGAERRRYPRSSIPFYVTVGGTDLEGDEVEDAAILHNISQGGLYIRVSHCLSEGADVSCLIRFSENAGGPELRARGKVLRVEVRTLGVCDMAVQFTHPLTEDAR
jgi:c-di-GMP-binding flagellar brake protein YcgR